MSFVEKHRFEGGRTEEVMLKIAWEGELFGRKERCAGAAATSPRDPSAEWSQQ